MSTERMYMELLLKNPLLILLNHMDMREKSYKK